MLVAEPSREHGVVSAQAVDSGRVADGTERVENDRDVDELLQQRAPRGWEITERGDEHGRDRQTHAADHALEREPAGTARDHQRLAEPIEPIHGEDDIGGLR